MADALAAAGKSILIAGSGHTRTDRAVPWVLGLMRPRDTVAALAFVEVAADSMSPAITPFFLATPACRTTMCGLRQACPRARRQSPASEIGPDYLGRFWPGIHLVAALPEFVQ